MVNIILDLKKKLEENAASYFEKAKKAKKKIKGAEKALIKIRKKLADLEKKEEVYLKKVGEELEKKATAKKERRWYHKFRWFITSEGFLVIGGRDATTNEIVIKKHADKDDFVFHTDMAGSPFFVLKTEGKKPSKKSLLEVADATVTFSRAWKLGLGTQSVFYVKPEQVTKEAMSGEYLTKGAFMIKGKTNYLENKTNCSIGLTEEGEMMAGPTEAVKKHCKKNVEIIQGDHKVSSIAKLIQKKVGGDLDEIIRALPSGGCKIKTE